MQMTFDLIFLFSVLCADRLTQMTLNFDPIFLFSVLCGDRLTQMTKTYNDVEAVTRLLEEVRFTIQKKRYGAYLMIIER